MNRRIALLIGWLACALVVTAQEAPAPRRLLYFPDTGRNYAALDPGQELLQRNLLISNQAGNYGVSFALSYDQNAWSGFALGPRYSSIFSLDGREGCYIRIRTQFNPLDGNLTEIVYRSEEHTSELQSRI